MCQKCVVKSDCLKVLDGQKMVESVVSLSFTVIIIIVVIRAVPNIRFVFASGPNSGMNSYSVFGRIVEIGPSTNSDICFFVCGDHSEWRCCRR